MNEFCCELHQAASILTLDSSPLLSEPPSAKPSGTHPAWRLCTYRRPKLNAAVAGVTSVFIPRAKINQSFIANKKTALRQSLRNQLSVQFIRASCPELYIRNRSPE